jgi:hypothetical protein
METSKIIQLKKKINQIKKRLITKAQKNGLWENFGQNECQKLEDEYFEHMIHSTTIREMILDFNEWCSTYNL